mmetsp:Transcript_17390/g.36755  ORF Transcript_17390/g.36755 Transcript_17390/m.36755 type:complete len:320 (+) Transcript_17390:594-1553(+)
MRAASRVASAGTCRTRSPGARTARDASSPTFIPCTAKYSSSSASPTSSARRRRCASSIAAAFTRSALPSRYGRDNVEELSSAEGPVISSTAAAATRSKSRTARWSASPRESRTASSTAARTAAGSSSVPTSPCSALTMSALAWRRRPSPRQESGLPAECVSIGRRPATNQRAAMRSSRVKLKASAVAVPTAAACVGKASATWARISSSSSPGMPTASRHAPPVSATSSKDTSLARQLSSRQCNTLSSAAPPHARNSCAVLKNSFWASASFCATKRSRHGAPSPSSVANWHSGAARLSCGKSTGAASHAPGLIRPPTPLW